MAATITWSQHGYYAETTGKKLVTKIKWKCTAVEGSSTAFEEGVMDLDEQSQDQIDDVSVFATDSNLISVVKSRLGDDQGGDIEARVTAGLALQWYTT